MCVGETPLDILKSCPVCNMNSIYYLTRAPYQWISTKIKNKACNAANEGKPGSLTWLR